MPKKITLKIAHLMSKKGINKSDLMKKLDIAYGTALRLADGEAKNISFDVLAQLCELLDTTPGEILILEDGSDKPAKKSKSK